MDVDDFGGLKRERAWKPSKSDDAMRNFYAVSAAPTMASKILIGRDLLVLAVHFCSMPVAVVDCPGDAHVEHQ